MVIVHSPRGSPELREQQTTIALTPMRDRPLLTKSFSIGD
jgi:hypothetical protein